MIAKLPKKDIIALIYITILTGVALWYGFTSVPSPEKQREIIYDQTRMNNINAIQVAIADYYTQKTGLPMSLDTLTTDSFIAAKDIMDPQTNQQYEYTTTSETEYKVCATFATDSAQQKDTTRDRYYYSSLDKENHPKGYYCFTKSVLPEDDTYTPLDTDYEEQSDAQDNTATPSAGSNGVG